MRKLRTRRPKTPDEDTIDYTVRRIPRAVHTALGHEALDRGISIQDLLIEILTKAAQKSTYYKPEKKTTSRE